MPMIDVYAPEGSFTHPHQLARELARTLMTIEGVPDIPMFRQNTAAFVHALSDDAISNVEGTARAKVQVLTNFEALDRPSNWRSSASSPISSQPRRRCVCLAAVWVLLTEAVNGVGPERSRHTNAELVDAARAQIAELASEEGN